jgi:hypothetical protein
MGGTIMEDESYDQKIEILLLQKELMTKVLDYQINYGAESVSWNVTVSFNERRKV